MVRRRMIGKSHLTKEISTYPFKRFMPGAGAIFMLPSLFSTPLNQVFGYLYNRINYLNFTAYYSCEH